MLTDCLSKTSHTPVQPPQNKKQPERPKDLHRPNKVRTFHMVMACSNCGKEAYNQRTWSRDKNEQEFEYAAPTGERHNINIL